MREGNGASVTNFELISKQVGVGVLRVLALITCCQAMKGSKASSKAPVKVVKKKQEGWWTPPRKPKKVPGISEKTC